MDNRDRSGGQEDTVGALLALCTSLCGWLSSQRGIIPNDYAKDLAKLITRLEKERTNSD